MQRYFVEAFTAGASPMAELLANIRRLRQHRDALGIPVVYSAQPGGGPLEGEQPAEPALSTAEALVPTVACTTQQVSAAAPGGGSGYPPYTSFPVTPGRTL